MTAFFYKEIFLKSLKKFHELFFVHRLQDIAAFHVSDLPD